MVGTSSNQPRLMLRRWVRVVLASSVLGLAGCANAIDVAKMEYFEDDKKVKIFKVKTYQDCDKARQRMKKIENYIISVNKEGRYEPITQELHADVCNEKITVKQSEIF